MHKIYLTIMTTTNNRSEHMHKICQHFQHIKVWAKWPPFCKHHYQVNSLRPSDAIWRQRSWTTLVQVMACCLMAPSHHLNQCWLIINKALWQSIEGYFKRDNTSVKIAYRKFQWNPPGLNELSSDELDNHPIIRITDDWFPGDHFASLGHK